MAREMTSPGFEYVMTTNRAKRIADLAPEEVNDLWAWALTVAPLYEGRPVELRKQVWARLKNIERHAARTIRRNRLALAQYLPGQWPAMVPYDEDTLHQGGHVGPKPQHGQSPTDDDPDDATTPEARRDAWDQLGLSDEAPDEEAPSGRSVSEATWRGPLSEPPGLPGRNLGANDWDKALATATWHAVDTELRRKSMGYTIMSRPPRFQQRVVAHEGRYVMQIDVARAAEAAIERDAIGFRAFWIIADGGTLADAAKEIGGGATAESLRKRISRHVKPVLVRRLKDYAAGRGMKPPRRLSQPWNLRHGQDVRAEFRWASQRTPWFNGERGRLWCG